MHCQCRFSKTALGRLPARLQLSAKTHEVAQLADEQDEHQSGTSDRQRCTRNCLLQQMRLGAREGAGARQCCREAPRLPHSLRARTQRFIVQHSRWKASFTRQAASKSHKTKVRGWERGEGRTARPRRRPTRRVFDCRIRQSKKSRPPPPSCLLLFCCASLSTAAAKAQLSLSGVLWVRPAA